MYTFLLIVQYIGIVGLFFECGYIIAKMETKLQAYLYFYCAVTLVNNIGYLFEITSKNMDAYVAGLKMSYLGRVWIPYSLLIFIMTLCRIKINRKYFIGLSFIHSTTFILVFFYERHSLYYTTGEYITDSLVPHVNFGHGIWYNFYNCFLFIYIIVGFVAIIRTLIKENNKPARIRLSYVLAMIIVETLAYIINFIGISKSYDFTFMGYTIGTILLFIAIFKDDIFSKLKLVKDYVVDELSEGIIAVNNVGGLEYYNKPAELIFDNLKENYNEVLQTIRQAIEEKKPIVINGRYYSPEEKDLMQEKQSQGKIYALIDDTEHFEHMAALEEQKKIAEEANQSKSAFLSVVSHELRTPMNAVVGMTELLLRDSASLNSKQEKYLRNIQTSGSSLVMIVNDILDQSKIQSGKMEIVEDAYELRPMTEDVRLIIENRIGSKPIHLIYEIEDDVPAYLIGDSLRIRQILINLMNNAVKFTESGYIRLGIKCEDVDSGKRLLRFSVRDSGQGIKPEDLSKLGQAFIQVDSKSNHFKEGTGLGLSISRDFIQMMGGQLLVESTYGKGTEFYFSIWQGVSSKESFAGSNVCKQAWQEEEQFTAPNAKVLVVDDTELNLMIAKELLAPIGMTVETVESGEGALALMKENKYHVIFMDYMMPYMDGVETTTRIRAEDSDYFRTVPIVALSGDDSNETKEKFLGAGIDDFIEKPLDIKRMKKILLKWLPKELIVMSRQ